MTLPKQILIKETRVKFGYNPKDLKPSSSKLVLAKCLQCNIIREKKFREAKIVKLCTSCANTNRAREYANENSVCMKEFYSNGGRHPLEGAGHTDETKLKMSLTKKGLIPERKSYA